MLSFLIALFELKRPNLITMGIASSTIECLYLNKEARCAKIFLKTIEKEVKALGPNKAESFIFDYAV